MFLVHNNMSAMYTEEMTKKIILHFVAHPFTQYLKVPPQYDFFVSFISNSFCKKSKLLSIHCNMLARLCNFYMWFL